MPVDPTSLLAFLAGRATRVQTRTMSREAARSIEDVSGRLRMQIFNYIASRGVLGATCDEVEGALCMKHQTASARVHELMKSGHIIDSSQRRLTTSNRRAIVWVINAARFDH